MFSAQIEEVIESAHVHQNPEALYATPMKRSQRKSTSSTMRNTANEVRSAMQQVHDLSTDDESPAPVMVCDLLL